MTVKLIEPCEGRPYTEQEKQAEAAEVVRNISDTAMRLNALISGAVLHGLDVEVNIHSKRARGVTIPQVQASIWKQVMA